MSLSTAIIDSTAYLDVNFAMKSQNFIPLNGPLAPLSRSRSEDSHSNDNINPSKQLHPIHLKKPNYPAPLPPSADLYTNHRRKEAYVLSTPTRNNDGGRIYESVRIFDGVIFENGTDEFDKWALETKGQTQTSKNGTEKIVPVTKSMHQVRKDQSEKTEMQKIANNKGKHYNGYDYSHTPNMTGKSVPHGNDRVSHDMRSQSLSERVKNMFGLKV
ncbi:hypothetical protein RFI_14846 [Reticulomyxa filosa]|uniref:Uncharacterized protein n=1 Tax=Reticulomyxa filosa TaxID=46433 RepID=X6N8Y0_RETFI|nr:hypothetical protein RFI_14846 [Reticulomyxa filosa]|eukprot:ETO22353.1 hypothetical protein RFI_14846 [Reticulomyxa filosa]